MMAMAMQAIGDRLRLLCGALSFYSQLWRSLSNYVITVTDSMDAWLRTLLIWLAAVLRTALGHGSNPSWKAVLTLLQLAFTACFYILAITVAENTILQVPASLWFHRGKSKHDVSILRDDGLLVFFDARRQVRRESYVCRATISEGAALAMVADAVLRGLIALCLLVFFQGALCCRTGSVWLSLHVVPIDPPRVVVGGLLRTAAASSSAQLQIEFASAVFRRLLRLLRSSWACSCCFFTFPYKLFSVSLCAASCCGRRRRMSIASETTDMTYTQRPRVAVTDGNINRNRQQHLAPRVRKTSEKSQYRGPVDVDFYAGGGCFLGSLQLPEDSDALAPGKVLKTGEPTEFGASGPWQQLLVSATLQVPIDSAAQRNLATRFQEEALFRGPDGIKYRVLLLEKIRTLKSDQRLHEMVYRPPVSSENFLAEQRAQESEAALYWRASSWQRVFSLCDNDCSAQIKEQYDKRMAEIADDFSVLNHDYLMEKELLANYGLLEVRFLATGEFHVYLDGEMLGNLRDLRYSDLSVGAIDEKWPEFGMQQLNVDIFNLAGIEHRRGFDPDPHGATSMPGESGGKRYLTCQPRHETPSPAKQFRLPGKSWIQQGRNEVQHSAFFEKDCVQSSLATWCRAANKSLAQQYRRGLSATPLLTEKMETCPFVNQYYTEQEVRRARIEHGRATAKILDDLEPQSDWLFSSKFGMECNHPYILLTRQPPASTEDEHHTMSIMACLTPESNLLTVNALTKERFDAECRRRREYVADLLNAHTMQWTPAFQGPRLDPVRDGITEEDVRIFNADLNAQQADLQNLNGPREWEVIAAGAGVDANNLVLVNHLLDNDLLAMDVGDHGAVENGVHEL
ncbi:unnamed protein product [Amoebophrya sp. A120]|nr:unnamed protein product [Amoebophrya sp. A120]|eukprot:GSA120T00020559001.1